MLSPGSYQGSMGYSDRASGLSQWLQPRRVPLGVVAQISEDSVFYLIVLRCQYGLLLQTSLQDQQLACL